MKVSVLGCGRWGGLIAWYLHTIKKFEVTSWGPAQDPIFQKLSSTGANDYLEFPKEITVTSDLSKALESDLLVISISSQRLREFASKLNEHDLQGKCFILAMKGLEDGTGKRLTQVMREQIKQDIELAIWVGPGHVQSFVKMVPNCMVICSEKRELTKRLVKLLESSLIRFYYGEDMIGNEVGAAAKNVMGLAAGMLDGLGLKALKGALMARGAREVARLIAAMGGKEITAYGLCHLGDYEATLFSENSNNRKFGQMVVEGKEFDKLAEGVATSSAILQIAGELGVDMPITKVVNNVVQSKANPEQQIKNLFLRPLKREF